MCLRRLWTEVPELEHSADHVHRSRVCLGAEKHIADDECMESNEDCYDVPDFRFDKFIQPIDAPIEAHPLAVNNQRHALKNSPRHMVPGGAVPQSCQPGREKEVEVNAHSRTARATQWNVHIVSEPVRKRDVLAVPEFAYVV